MANEPQTPPQETVTPHWPTPIRAAVIANAQLIDSLSPTTRRTTHQTKRAYYQRLNVPDRTARRIIKSRDPRTRHNSILKPETRGRKAKLTNQDIRYCELVLRRYAEESRSLSWTGLAYECNLEVSARTLQRAMRQLNYRRCLSCRRSWVNAETAALRVEFAKTMLAKYPLPSDWHHVRFSDETHLGFGPPGRAWITRRPDEVDCPYCVQIVKEPRLKDEKRLHAWGVIGYEYKSPLYFYDNGTSNGKMDMKTYLGLLQREIPSYPPNIVLEEDRDSGHGCGKKTGPLQRYKAGSHISFYFNCPHAPDLSPIENAWLAPKEILRQHAHWDDNTVRELAVEGWRRLSQEKINLWVNSMPKRLQAVIDLKGQMTAF